ncbi:MAG: gliding motility-associated C-terminal domain-containing protein, partial [Saprospiraceae bacterium]|nr:gliding motility-associated C-terminal domain-containing protein [Saprospiraceae bacterium]
LLKLEIASVGTPYLEATDFVFDADSLVICLHGRFDTTPGLLSNQMALVKIAPSGQVIWARRFTINNQNTSSTVFVTQGLVAGADGYYVVTRDFLLKTDQYGRLMWVRHTYGRHDVGRNLAVEQNGSVFLVGKNVNPGGIFLARYEAATGDAGSRCGQDFGISIKEDDLTDISTVPFNWTPYSSPLFMQNNTAAPSAATLSDVGYLCNSPCFEICGNGRSDDYDNLSDCVDPACLCIACNGEQARIWYFGIHAGLDFSTDPPSVLTDGATDSPGATGVMCDAGGNLLLYTDGETIFNRNHQPLPEGTGIAGVNTSLANMLIPLSSSVFSLQHANTSTNFNPYYTEIDLGRDQGLGDVRIVNDQLQKNQIADLTPVSDKVAATRACTGIDSWWVLRKRRNVEQFFVFEINAANNIATQSFSIDIGELDQNTFGNNVVAQMKFNHAGTLLADALPNSAGFDLFEFDPALGGMSTFASIRQNDLAGVYALEFSPNDRFLYVATPTRLYQYDLQAGSAQAIAQSRVLLANSATPRFGALQTGPNGKIYIATGAGAPADALDVIFQPDQAGSACQYQANAQPLGSGRVRYGLPCIAPGLAVPRERVEIQGPDSLCGLPAQSIYVLKNSALCIGADSIAWELSGGSGGLFNIQNYVVQFQDTGVYRLVAKVWFDCGLKTDTLFVTVTADEAPALNLGPDIKVCENGVFQLDAGAGFERYRWQDGTPEQTLTTSFPGAYWVTVWDACGNTQTDTIKITIDPGTQLDLGPNRVVCRLEGTTFELPDNFESWEWSPGALLGCDTCETITVYPAAIVNYVVTARNADGCLSTDTVRVSPLLLGAVLDTQICRGAALEYLGIPLPNTVDTSFLLDIVTPEGCDLLLTTIIDIFPPVQVQLPADTTLKIGAELALNVLVGGGAAPYQYAWSAPGFLSCDDCPDPVVRPLQAVAYTVVVTDANGCTGSDDIILYVDDSCEVRAPTAFTPDADGTNDTFYLLCDPCVDQVRSLRIWSRWGEEVYLGVNLPPNDAALGWDGRSRNGRAFPSDVLFWSAEVIFFDGRLERFQGELTLIR